MTAGPDGRAGIDAALVTRLLHAQFPQFADLPVTPVAVDGVDNRTYRLGEDMTVRLPTAAGYVPAVDKENEWLPRLAPQLPLPVPRIIGRGEPGEGYPFPWSIRGWLPGEASTRAPIADLVAFAESLAAFLHALQRCDTVGAPPAGEHSWYRGASPAFYDEETRRCLSAVSGLIDVPRAERAWEAALAEEWRGTPVWFHGDIASGNLLVRDGALSAVIDFGTSGVGDPACDLVIAWTMFARESREAFRAAMGCDEAMWARARGWVLWKTMLVLSQVVESDPGEVATCRRLIEDVLDDASL
ncbi:MAG: aminoglycoside phosphotransferase family protein [Kineosporiaceae bacterium]